VGGGEQRVVGVDDGKSGGGRTRRRDERERERGKARKRNGTPVSEVVGFGTIYKVGDVKGFEPSPQLRRTQMDARCTVRWYGAGT
jgi:hypothetical protein